MKILKRIVCIVLMATLVFASMIGSAFSYQEAKTLTSENVFSIGEANAYLSANNLSERRELYPTELIPLTPEIVNNGNTSFWAILALKVPAINEPYSDGSMLLNNKDGRVIYPAFYPYISNVNDNKIAFTANATLNGGAQIPFDEDMTEEYKIYSIDNCSSFEYNSNSWKLLDLCTDYAKPGDGEFFIYYFGLQQPLAPNQKAPDIWAGLAAANFQKNVYDMYYTGELFEKELPSFNNNFGVEMRLFTVQSDYNEAIINGELTEAWEYCKQVHSKFGTQTVISLDVESEYTSGDHLLPIYVTSDVKKVQVVNDTTGAKQTIDISSDLEVIDDYISVAKVPVSIVRSGDYYISTVDTDGNALNRTYLGYITVSE